MEVARVQSLAHGGLDDLPAHFIRPTHERPENSKAIEGVTVPVISLSQPRDVLVQEISAASRDWGFFLVKDHGTSPALIKLVQEVGQEFFGLPQEEKEKYANDPSEGKFEGYGTKMIKNTDQKLEWVDYYFHLMSPSSKVNHEVWPKNPPAYREVTEEYNKEILRITNEILSLLSEGLNLDKDVLKSHLGADEIEVEMKINMYPPCPQPDLALGVEPHTDMSALTILVPNEVSGLQVWKDGNWVAVDYYPDALYIHIGDQIQVLSNGKYKSVLHRSLVNKERTRMSWAVFCVPPGDAVIGPLPELLNDDNPDEQWRLGFNSGGGFDTVGHFDCSGRRRFRQWRLGFAVEASTPINDGDAPSGSSLRGDFDSTAFHTLSTTRTPLFIAHDHDRPFK